MKWRCENKVSCQLNRPHLPFPLKSIRTSSLIIVNLGHDVQNLSEVNFEMILPVGQTNMCSAFTFIDAKMVFLCLKRETILQKNWNR